MAREIVKVELYGQNNDGNPRRYTCASGVRIPKGTFLKNATPRTASASTGTGDVFGGFAAMEKAADDLSTSVSAWTDGIATCTASGAIVVGQKTKTAAPGNYVMAAVDADVTSSYAKIVGVAQNTAANGGDVAVRFSI